MINLNGNGKLIAIVDGGTHKIKKRKGIYIDDSLNNDSVCDSDGFERYKLNKNEGTIQPIIDPDTERAIVYVTGPSGSGKSYFSANYIKNYKKIYPDNEIYVFSSLNEDPSIDHLNPKRINMNNDLKQIETEDFNNSLVLFDDIDSIIDKEKRKDIYNILNHILQTGRHHYISAVITNHLPTAGKDTSNVLNESHLICYFPNSGSLHHTNYLLDRYVGISKEMKKYFKQSKSRWVCIKKNYPQVAMLENEIIQLSALDD